MSPVSIAILALGMSIDAMVAALGRGAAMRRPSLGTALKTGAIFGAVEALTPLLGWAMGIAAASYVQAVDHWIAFVLLGGVGGRMAVAALRRDPTAQGEAEAAPTASLAMLLLTAVGTSIDAMAVGVSLAFLDVDILTIALAIGLATALMSTGGILAGRLLGQRFGRYAEIVGGIALIGLGTAILIEHLTA